MSKEGSTAPKERINIKYTPATGDQQAEVELPLKMLVTGDFTGKPQDESVEDREIVSIDKNTFNSVMENAELSVSTTVENVLDEEVGGDIPVELSFATLADFSPDSLVKQVPELDKLIQLREALQALKGPVGNIPAFRDKLQDLVSDEGTRDQLEQELELVLAEKNAGASEQTQAASQDDDAPQEDDE